MALSYLDIGATVNDINFQFRVIGALEAQCILVNSEAGATPNHAQRQSLLGRVVVDPAGYARKFTPLIASVNPLVGLGSLGAATDAQILSGVQAVWDALALLAL
jgi:hypothetical protein